MMNQNTNNQVKQEEYIYQLWAVTTWLEDNNPRKSRYLLGLYTTEGLLKDTGREIFQSLLEDPENRYIHVYGVKTPVNRLFDPDETEDLEYGLKIDRRKRSSGCLFITNTNPV